MSSSSLLLATKRKAVKKGLSFTLMLVGSAGLGKTSFINTLCETTAIEKRPVSTILEASSMKTLSIDSHHVDLEEDGVKLQLTVIDTPGFGDNINNDSNFQTILNYIETQYDEILSEETRIKRNPKFQDNRVHVVLYFIAPTGHSLREIDIEFMMKLGSRVNVIPVVAKADSFTSKEMAEFKKRIMEDIAHYNIPIYAFPDEEDEDDLVAQNKEFRELLPFAVIAADTVATVNGRKTPCRQYPWGNVEVENSRHSDFSKLKFMLFSSHMQDLKEATHDMLYESYRTEKLSKTEGKIATD